jgi:hypothetical protein
MRKHTLAALLAASVALGAFAQSPAASSGPDMAAIKQAAATDKRGLVEKNMQLSPEEAAKFWPIYDEYQKDLDRIVKRQNSAVLDYVKSESNMNDATARRLAREVVTADGEEQKLREKTMRKMLAALPAKKAVRFMQIENKLRAFYRNDIAEQIPLIK